MNYASRVEQHLILLFPFFLSHGAPHFHHTVHRNFAEIHIPFLRHLKFQTLLNDCTQFHFIARMVLVLLC